MTVVKTMSQKYKTKTQTIFKKTAGGDLRSSSIGRTRVNLVFRFSVLHWRADLQGEEEGVLVVAVGGQELRLLGVGQRREVRPGGREPLRGDGGRTLRRGDTCVFNINPPPQSTAINPPFAGPTAMSQHGCTSLHLCMYVCIHVWASVSHINTYITSTTEISIHVWVCDIIYYKTSFLTKKCQTAQHNWGQTAWCSTRPQSKLVRNMKKPEMEGEQGGSGVVKSLCKIAIHEIDGQDQDPRCRFGGTAERREKNTKSKGSESSIFP